VSGPAVPVRVVEAVGSREAVCAALVSPDPTGALVGAGVDEDAAKRLVEAFRAAGQVAFADGSTFGRVSGIEGRVLHEKKP
jgi:hypothetical protein